MEIAYSVRGVPIRLTDERWSHIVEAHDEMAGRMDQVLTAVERPDWVTRGHRGSLIAWKAYGPRRFLSAVYRELSKVDGFVITAYFTCKVDKRSRLWP